MKTGGICSIAMRAHGEAEARRIACARLRAMIDAIERGDPVDATDVETIGCNYRATVAISVRIEPVERRAGR